jgi:hypothetical protein
MAQDGTLLPIKLLVRRVEIGGETYFVGVLFPIDGESSRPG